MNAGPTPTPRPAPPTISANKMRTDPHRERRRGRAIHKCAPPAPPCTCPAASCTCPRPSRRHPNAMARPVIQQHQLRTTLAGPPLRPAPGVSRRSRIFTKKTVVYQADTRDIVVSGSYQGHSPPFTCLTGVRLERGAKTTLNGRELFFLYTRPLSKSVANQEDGGQIWVVAIVPAIPWPTTTGAMRPTPAELEVARALIARVKAADSSIKRVDELLVCAAVACRSGEFGGVPTACARAMGKNISKPKQVTDWIARLEKLVQAPASEPDSGLLVQTAWIEQNVPGIRELAVASMVVSPGKRHGTRSIDAVSSTPLGSTRATSTTVDYTLPPAQGERESEGKKRTRRHWNREANQVRSLDLSGAAEAHAARDAEMQRVARAAEREVRDVLDRVIVRVEREIQREARTRARAAALGAAQPWRWCCPAGCKRGSHCAREAFRERCLPTLAAIQAQRRKQWDSENLTKVFVSYYSGYAYNMKEQRRLLDEQDQRAQAWQ